MILWDGPFVHLPGRDLEGIVYSSFHHLLLRFSFVLMLRFITRRPHLFHDAYDRLHMLIPLHPLLVCNNPVLLIAHSFLPTRLLLLL